MHRLIISLLAASLAFISTGVAAAYPASAESAAVPAHAESVALPARLAAVSQYQRDLVSVLVLRADARHLLGAALLARPLGDPEGPSGFSALLARATQADDAGAVVTWVNLSDCEADHCPNLQALDALTKSDADNAAVWLLRMDLAVRDHDDDAARANLLKAAAASRYDDYTGSILQALIAAVTALPAPPATVQAFADGSDAGPASVQTFLAFSLANVLPRPSLIPASHWCDPTNAPPAAGDIREACQKLAHVLVWGSSPQAHATGLHLEALLSTDPAQQRSATDAQHDLAWQLRNYSRLALKAIDDDTIAVQMLKLANSGGTEMSFITAVLRQQHIPPQAPDAGVPPTEPGPASSSPTTPAPASSSPATPAPASSSPVTPAPASSTPEPDDGTG